MEISVREARNHLRAVLEQVQAGEEIVLQRRGKEIARLIPPHGKKKKLPSLQTFRDSIIMNGESVSELLKVDRSEERL